MGTTTFRPPYTPVAFAALAGRDRGALVRPRAHHGAARLACRTRRGVRGRRAVEAPAVLPAVRAKTWTTRCCANAPRCAAVSAFSTAPRSARSTCRAATPAELLDRHLHQPDEQPEGRLGPLRRDVRRRRNGDRRRHRDAAGRGPVPGVSPPPAARRRSSTGWRNGCRPSGRNCRCHCTSVTEQWATFPVVGPRSRDVIGAVFAELDVANEAFPFMTWRDTSARRACRAALRGSASPASSPTRSTSTAGTRRGVGAADRRRRAVRHHPVRHRDHARAARREGLSDHRPGHRRHRHARTISAWRGRSRRRSPTSSASARSAASRTRTRCASSSSGCCRSTASPGCRRARRSSSSARTTRFRRHRFRCWATSPRAIAAPSSAARSRWLWSRPAGPASARPCTCPSTGRSIPVEVTGSVLVDPEGARRDG